MNITKLAFAAPAAIAALISLSPAAQAGPDANFLSCLNDHGYVVTDATYALHLASLIQTDESNNASRSDIIWNLEYLWGLDSRKANVYIDCAWTA